MATIKQCRVGLAAQIGTATTRYATFGKVPARLVEPSVVAMYAGAANARETMGRGFWQFNLEARIYDPMSGGDTIDAEDHLEAGIAWEGAESVPAAIEADPTLGGLVATVATIEGLTEFETAEVGGRRFLTCAVKVAVITKGTASP